MGINRRELGILSAATLIGSALPAAAAEPGAIISGEPLTANLDPHVLLDALSMSYTLNAYDSLYRYVGDPAKIEPWLAESSELSTDGLTWTIKLRSGVKFHDGQPVTADDVVYSFQRLLKLAGAPAVSFVPVLKPENITTPEPNVVRFVLNRPYAPFFSALPLVYIVNSKLLKQHEKDGDWGAAWLASNEAGSGAFALIADTYRALERIDLKRFEAHFRGWQDVAKPLDFFRLHGAKETSTRVLALLNGTIDLTDRDLASESVERLEKSPAVRVQKNNSMRTFLIRMNNSKPPFDNINARKCFAHAFNYAGYISEIMKNNVKRNPSPLPLDLWGSPKDLFAYNYDLAKAKEYFDKAKAEGAPMTRPIEFYTYAISEVTLTTAQVFQSDLAQIGINLKIVNSQWANILTMAVNPATAPDVWCHWVSAYFLDPENWAGAMYDSKAHGTWRAASFYKNAKVDEWLDAARLTTVQADRQAAYEKAITQIVADCPDIWVYNSIDVRGLSKRVGNFEYCSVGAGMEARKMQLKA
jgi:peptide/nickel transport system substrate-binding protein